MSELSDCEPEEGPSALHEPLSQRELAHFERLLRERLGALQGEVGSLEDDVLRRSGGDRFQPDDEPIEEGELDVEAGALAVEDELGYEVRAALRRMREGTFGLCGSCGEWISRERLHLVPHARECGACVRRPQSDR